METQTEYAENIVKIGLQIASLNATQARSLINYLDEEYGIETPENGPSVCVQEQNATVEDVKTIFDVHVLAVENPAQRIGVIKLVREVTGLGLGEAKAFVDALPKMLKEGVPQAEADTIAKKLKEAGAKVEIK